MLLWWLTLFVSLEPLTNLLTWMQLVQSGTSVDQDSSAAAVKPEQNRITDAGGNGTQEWWNLEDDDDDLFGEGFDLEVKSSLPPAGGSSSVITGTYRYENSTNLDEYLEEMGLSYVLRKLTPVAVPICTISKQCPEVWYSHDHYAFDSTGTFAQLLQEGDHMNILRS